MLEYYHGTGKLNEKVINEIKDYLYPNISRIIFISCNIIFTIVLVLYVLIGAFIYAAFTAMVIIMLSAINLYLKKYVAKKFLNGFKELGISELVYDMIFYEDNITIKNISADNAIRLEYKNIKIIVETDSMLFFCTKNNLPFPLIKDCLTDNKKYELLDLLKEKNPQIRLIGIL